MFCCFGRKMMMMMSQTPNTSKTKNTNGKREKQVARTFDGQARRVERFLVLYSIRSCKRVFGVQTSNDACTSSFLIIFN